MSERQPFMWELYLGFRRLFTFFLQTNPRYFHAFVHRNIGPRYLSIPKILLCTIGIALIAPAMRFFFPVLTYAPLKILPFANVPAFPLVERGRFIIGGGDLLPFVLLAIAFLITATRRHLQGERLIIEGQELHSYAHGIPRFFADSLAARVVWQPLVLFAVGAAYAYAALWTGAFHPAFGSFLIAGAVDLSLTTALLNRHWSIALRDQIDAEIGAASFQHRRDRAAPKNARPGYAQGSDEEPVGFRRARPRDRS